MSAGILYLHGFCSSPESWKARLLADAMTRRGQGERFFCPFLSPVPREAIAQAEEIIHREAGPLAVVGSSLGGFYATWLAEKFDLRAVLVNPAVVAPPVAAVPTMETWGLLAMGALLAGFGVRRVRKQG